jgi:photosystem II stability/assembly factor-like uncharacterized protein
MRGRLIVVLIVLLVAADVVLITLSVRRGHGGTVGGAPVSAPVIITTTTTTGPTPSETPSGDGVDQALVAGAESIVLRATAGSCKTGDTPTLELSTDSGVTFKPTADRLDVAQVLRVVVASASDVWFVGTDDTCTPSTWHWDGAGSGWSLSPGSAGAWHMVPSVGSFSVHAPTGRVGVDCSVASLSPIDGQTARVLCASGMVLGTADSGSSWVNLGHLDAAQVMDYDSTASGVALGSTPSCDVQAFTTSDGGSVWTRTDCLQGAHAQALAYHAGSAIALVDDAVLISSDGGQTWSAP